MNDRQPGAPGQHKAIITAAELQKMQAGKQFTITLTRDDQPIVEGTPYSKAAVLPDALANIICPDEIDPTPADALRALMPRNGKAAMTGNLPMGGKKVTELGNPTEDGDAVSLGFANQSFAPAGYGLGKISYSTGSQTRFTDASKLDEMTVNSFWAYQNSSAPLIPNQPDTSYVYGYTVASGKPYVTQRAVTLYGGSWIERTLGLRNSNGAWSEWKYVNPPMVGGKTYLTTEFFLSKPVYKEVMNLGAIAAGGGELSVNFNRTTPILHPISCKLVDTLGTTFPYVEFKPDKISVATPGDFPGGTVYAVLTYTLNE